MGPDDGVDRRKRYRGRIQNVDYVGGNIDGYTDTLRLFDDWVASQPLLPRHHAS